MKIKMVRPHYYPVFFLLILIITGCATGKSTEISGRNGEASDKLPPLPSQGMEELLITQTEPEKVLPFRKEGAKLISLSLRDAEIKEVLLALAKKSDFNVIVDPDVGGNVTVDLQRVTLKEALDSLLDPLNLDYRKQGRFIRVLRPRMETRIFIFNYVSIKRKGSGRLTVSGGVSEAEGDDGGSGGGSGGVGGEEESEAAIQTENGVYLWRDIQGSLETIIFGDSEDSKKETGAAWSRGDERGKRLVANPMAGIILVKAYPDVIEEVAEFLLKIEASIKREVIIQAKIVEITLDDAYEMGIDWNALTKIGALDGNLAGEWVFGQNLNPATGIFQIGVTSGDFTGILDAMAEQGSVNMLSSPRICTLNNQKAIIKVGREEVYWETETQRSEEYGWVVEGAESRTITVGIVLDVTPQIGPNGSLTMHVHPSVSEVTGQSVSRFGDTRPVLDVREADTMVRVNDGQTIIIGGMMKDKKTEQIIKVPFLGDIPFLGKLFRYTGQSTQKTELAIFLTPTVLMGKRVDDLTRQEERQLKEMEREFHLGGQPGKYGVGGEFFR